jgi:type I restriction enzyme S subunit
MAGEWQEVTIGKFAPFVYGKGLPEQTRNPNGAFPVFGSNGIVGWHDKPLTEGPTLIIGRKGTVGAVHFSLLPCWPIDTTFYITGYDFTLIRYRYYLLKSLGLEHMNSDSAVPGLNRDAAHARIVCIPKDESEQKAIAHILGTLDDKLELNRRMNKTMEEMARAIFKSWFVDFDPVHAKAAVRREHSNWTNAQVSRAALPKLNPEIAELFPDSFEDSELGEIPKGWMVKKIQDITERVSMGPFGSSIKVDTFVPEGIPIISGQHLNGLMLEDNTFNFITHEHAERLKNSNVERGDIVLTHAGNIGQVAYIPDNSRYEKYIISQRQFFMRCDRRQVTPRFMILYFKTGEGQYRLLANTSSSGVPSIAQPVTYLRTIPLITPQKLLIDTFDKLINPLFIRMRQNQNKSNTLSALRNALLPKLISGELRVKHAESFLKERRL